MNKKPKYLVRPSDYCIFEIDQSNGCYRVYEEDILNRPNAYKHFTFENLTENYDFFPITGKNLGYYEEKNDFEIKFMSWRCRPDGHGGSKGGTKDEYLNYLDRVKRFNDETK